MHETTWPKRGGKRPGAGRPPNSGKYGEPTVPVRVPLGLVEDVEDMIAEYMKNKNNRDKLVVKFEDK